MLKIEADAHGGGVTEIITERISTLTSLLIEER